MLQQSVLQSGCQGWNKNILDSGSGTYAYCSTLGVFVHSSKNNKLLAQHAAHERTITGMAWSRKHADRFFTCSVDMEVRQWAVHEEQPLGTFTLPGKPIMVDTCHAETDGGLCAVLVQPGQVHIWNTEAAENQLSQAPLGGGDGIKCIRWNQTKTAPRLAAGKNDGTVMIWDKELGSNSSVPLPVQLSSADDVSVVDLQWDPLSNMYLVATYSGGHMALINVENLAVQTVFNRKAKEICMAAFLPSTPGGFITVEKHAPILTLWNVSNPDPLELIRVEGKKTGMSCIKQAATPDHYVLGFSDGSVGLFDMRTRRVVFMSEPGHTETIFSVAFKPSDPFVLASASFDSSVKIWDSTTGRHLNTLKSTTGEDLGHLYSVSWAPKGEKQDRLMTGSSTGEVLVWNTTQQQIVARFAHHSKTVYKALWNPNDPDMAASTSADGYAIVFDSAGKILQKYRHPEGVYQCDWSYLDPNMLVTACHDGIVRVFNVAEQSSKPVHEFTGHKARVFCVAWSPLLPHLIASAGDDKTIMIWEIGKEKPLYELEGHEHNVRTIQWSFEIPYMLLSGSWDASIRMWDIRSRHLKCQHVVTNHTGDVYGLATHPERPFLFASASRDTSIRFFSMDETVVGRIKYQAVMGLGRIQDEHMKVAGKMMDPDDHLALAGTHSRVISEEFKALSEEERESGSLYPRFMNYWSGAPHLRELFSLALSVSTQSKGTHEGEVNHVDDLRSIIQAHAEKIESTTLDAEGGHRHSRLQKAAAIQLKLGNIKRFCEIMVEVGQWERALAVAPAHSMALWSSIASQYASHLMESGSTEAVPFLIATGETARLIEYESTVLYKTPTHLREALLSAVGEAVEGLPAKADEEAEEEEAKDDGERLEVPITEGVREVIEQMADGYMDRASPISAAACHLAIGDSARAVQRLMSGNELVLAGVLLKILKEEADYVWLAIAKRCEFLDLHHEALVCLNNLTADPTKHVIELASRYPGPLHAVGDFYLKANLSTPGEYAEQAAAQAAEGKVADAVVAYVAARKGKQALDLGLEFLRKHLAAQTSGWAELAGVMSSLESLDCDPATSSLEEADRMELMAYSFFFGVQRAIWKGFKDLAKAMVQMMGTLVERMEKHGQELAVPMSLVKMMLASFLVPSEPALANSIITEVIADAAAPPRVKTGAAAIKKTLDMAFPNGTKAVDLPSAHSVVPSGSNDPGSSFRSSRLSLVNGRPIQGNCITLNDGQSMAESEVIMMLQCTPFSPTLTGKRLNPFDFQYLGPQKPKQEQH